MHNFGGKPISTAWTFYDEVPGMREYLKGTNLFVNPRGKQYGEAYLLMDSAAVDSFESGNTYTLQLRGGEVFENIIYLRAERIPAATRLRKVHVVDRRYLINKSWISEFYNVLSEESSDSDGYIDESLNNGQPWTWEEMLEDIWSNLTNLPSGQSSFPGFPTGFTEPEESPEDFRFYAGNAWSALHDVLNFLNLDTVYDPFTDTISIVSIASENVSDANTELFNANSTNLVYKTDNFVPSDRPDIPSEVKIVFRTKRPPDDPWLITKPYWTETYTIGDYNSDSGTNYSTSANTVEFIEGDLYAYFPEEQSEEPENDCPLYHRGKDLGRKFYDALVGKHEVRIYANHIALIPDGSIFECHYGEKLGNPNAINIHGKPLPFSTTVFRGPTLPRPFKRPWNDYLDITVSVPVTTSSTTTTTGLNTGVDPDCVGRCKWSWVAADKEWTLDSDECSTTTTTTSTTTTSEDPSSTTTTTCRPTTTTTTTTTTSTTTTTQDPASTTTTTPECHCVHPDFCGSSDGDCTYTYCSKAIDSIPPCGQSTTSTTSTTTSSCDCNDPDFGCNCEYLCGKSGWVYIGSGCDDLPKGCQCLPSGDCAPSVCGITSGQIQCEPCYTQICDGLYGNCYWEWDGSQFQLVDKDCQVCCSRSWGFWYLFQECGGPYSPSFFSAGLPVCAECIDAYGCSPPTISNPELCKKYRTPCEVYSRTNRVQSSCQDDDPPCRNCFTSTSTSSSSTSSSTACEANECEYGWNGSSWASVFNNCGPDCDCAEPPFDGTDTCEVVRVACEETTTTTTTTTTSTTTTTAACAGNGACGYLCDGSGSWYQASSECVGVNVCPAPSGEPCTPGDSYIDCCTDPTTTTTTTTTSTSSSTTTTGGDPTVTTTSSSTTTS